VTVFVFVYYTL